MLPFWIALQFLSSLPIRLPGMPQPQELGRSLLFYPVVGLLFGVLLWGLNSVLMGAPLLLHAALLLTAWVLLSGGLHLDGLADSADAWLGGFGDRERTLTIMKDPRSGPIAVVTLGMVLLLKFTALVALIEQPNGAALILAPLIGRASMLALFTIVFGTRNLDATEHHRGMVLAIAFESLVNEHGIARHSERLYPDQYSSAEPLQAVIERTRQALIA
jgi:adenosylcobinamide-GDP ribazoletransferase